MGDLVARTKDDRAGFVADDQAQSVGKYREKWAMFLKQRKYYGME